MWFFRAITFVILRIDGEVDGRVDQFAQADIALAVRLAEKVRGSRSRYPAKKFLSTVMSMRRPISPPVLTSQVERHEGISGQPGPHKRQCQQGEYREDDGSGGEVHGEYPLGLGV